MWSVYIFFAYQTSSLQSLVFQALKEFQKLQTSEVGLQRWSPLIHLSAGAGNLASFTAIPKVEAQSPVGSSNFTCWPSALVAWNSSEGLKVRFPSNSQAVTISGTQKHGCLIHPHRRKVSVEWSDNRGFSCPCLLMACHCQSWSTSIKLEAHLIFHMYRSISVQVQISPAQKPAICGYSDLQRVLYYRLLLLRANALEIFIRRICTNRSIPPSSFWPAFSPLRQQT